MIYLFIHFYVTKKTEQNLKLIYYPRGTFIINILHFLRKMYLFRNLKKTLCLKIKQSA